MIQYDKIPELIENSKLNCFKITDMKGRKIVEHKSEDYTTEDAIHKLEELRPILEDQGRFKILAAHWDSCKSSWKGAHQWDVEMPNYEGPTSNYSMGNRLGGGMNMQMMSMMMGNMKDMMGLNLEKQRMEFDYMNQVSELRGAISETERSIVPPKYDKWVDLLIMRHMKLNPGEIAAMGQMYGPPGTGGAPPMAGGPVPVYAQRADQGSHVDSKGYTTDQVAQMETTLDSIQHKVPYEKLIELLQAVDKNPAIVDTALTFLKPN